MEEARELLGSRIWPKVRDRFLSVGEFVIYPRGDVRRLEYLDDETRRQVSVWKDAIAHVGEWRGIVDGAQVRALEAKYPGVYPQVLRFAAYFPQRPESPEQDSAWTLKLLKLKFPEAYEICCS